MGVWHVFKILWENQTMNNLNFGVMNQEIINQNFSRHLWCNSLVLKKQLKNIDMSNIFKTKSKGYVVPIYRKTVMHYFNIFWDATN